MHKQSLKLVYSDMYSWIISGSLFSILLTFLLSAREFLFFEPYLIFHITAGDVPSFVLIIVTSGLIALVTSLAIFQIRIIKTTSRKTGTGVIGSVIGIGAGVCTSCGQIGFIIISTFGVAGATSLSFLTEYEIPLRIVAIVILSGTYLLMVRGMAKKCSIQVNQE